MNIYMKRGEERKKKTLHNLLVYKDFEDLFERKRVRARDRV